MKCLQDKSERPTEFPLSDSAEKRFEAELEEELEKICTEEKRLQAELEAELGTSTQELQNLKDRFKKALEVSPMKMDDFESNKVECQKCGGAVFPHEAQIRGKMTWWCNGCNATMKSLRSRLSWPPNGFECLPDVRRSPSLQRSRR